jgi:hypothetical protein
MNDRYVGSASVLKPHVVELVVSSIAELFDSSMPACLGRPTLHGEIAEHFLERFAAAPANVPIKLILCVPAEEAARADVVETSLRAFFVASRDDEQRRLTGIRRDGCITAVIGLAFLLLLNVLGEAIRAAFPGQFMGAVASGMEIFGWVAMWRPAELLLYDWIPVRRKRNLLARLANLEVDCRPIERLVDPPYLPHAVAE